MGVPKEPPSQRRPGGLTCQAIADQPRVADTAVTKSAPFPAPAGGPGHASGETAITHTVRPSPFLKFALLADARASGAKGLRHLGASHSPSALLDLPHALLLGTGEFLGVYALLLVAMGTRPRLWSALVMVVALGNALWSLATVGLLLGGALSPSAMATVFVLVQAAAVIVFAALKWLGLPGSLPATVSGHAAMS